MSEKNSIDRLKQHGVEVIPVEWNLSRIKYLGQYINGYAFKPDDWSEEGKPIIRIQNLTDPTADPNRYSGEISDVYFIQKGDILISWSASLGVYRWDGEDAWLNQHIFKVILAEDLVLPDYFMWLADWFIAELDRDAHGSTMQHLTKDAFGSFPVLLPPHLEQRAIANYLDGETAQIDALIAAKQRLLHRLAEKRRALITHAVTRGLNPDAPMMESGLPWVGEIPAHWVTERAKWLFNERDERSEQGEGELLTVSHLTGVTPRSEKDVNMFMAESLEGYKKCRQGDLVINTMWAWMGAMGTAPVDGLVSPSYNVYGPTERMNTDYVDALVRTPNFVKEVTRFSKGVWSSRLRLYPAEFFDILWPIPPLEEQQAIVAHIDQETAKLDALRKTAEKSIALLKERRAALIAAAVTGKLNIEVPS